MIGVSIFSFPYFPSLLYFTKSLLTRKVFIEIARNFRRTLLNNKDKHIYQKIQTGMFQWVGISSQTRGLPFFDTHYLQTDLKKLVKQRKLIDINQI